MLLTLTLVVARSRILVAAIVLGGLDSFVGFSKYMCSVSLYVCQTGFIICLSWETILILPVIAILGIKLMMFNFCFHSLVHLRGLVFLNSQVL